MTEPTTLEFYMTELESMNPDAIAEMLRSEGITGDRSRNRTCPLAVYLCRRIGVDVHVYHTLTACWRNEMQEHRNGVNVRDFLIQFDEGCYPDLISGAPEPELVANYAPAALFSLLANGSNIAALLELEELPQSVTKSVGVS